MNKRIVSLLLCAVLLCLLCACGGEKGRLPASHSDIPTQRDLERILAEAEAEAEREAAKPKPVPEPVETPSRTGEVTLLVPAQSGGTETVKANLRVGGLAEGLTASLYAQEDWDWIVSEESLVLTSPGGADFWMLELRFLPGKSADAVAPGLLEGLDEIRTLEDLGQVAMAGRSARCVRGQGASLDWKAWVFDLPEGAVTMVLCGAGEDPILPERMELYGGTLELRSAY